MCLAHGLGQSESSLSDNMLLIFLVRKSKLNIQKLKKEKDAISTYNEETFHWNFCRKKSEGYVAKRGYLTKGWEVSSAFGGC